MTLFSNASIKAERSYELFLYLTTTANALGLTPFFAGAFSGFALY